MGKIAGVAPGKNQAGSRSGRCPRLPTGRPRRPRARQRHLALCLREYHGAQELVSYFATLSDCFCQLIVAANGKNPTSIVAPCHRVIGTNGALTGFAGGLAAKERLLAIEGALLTA